ncbi:MAG TPA: sulfotransferase [Lacipirellulaceae bacterium]|nr:sulfotransferase [Lacipirellulaceae bacterium]
MPETSSSATGVIVLGPYRSGTSVTSQVLSALGVDFGPKRYFVPASQNNPGGFYERVDINQANELLLESGGQSLAYPGDPRELSKHADIHMLDGANMNWRRANHYWGVKDPRFCATLFTWIDSGRMDRNNLRIVHVRRKLEPAVRSSMTFSSIRNFCDGTEASVRKMLDRYAELAQWHVDELQLPTFAFDYERLVKEPELVVQQLADFLSVTSPTKLRRAIRIIGKGKGMFALQLERYLIRAPRRVFYFLTGRNKDGSPRAAK